MIHNLLISVRFHDGRYHGAGDWPPSPARLFQALVAAAAQPTLDSARPTLQWLEQLDAPVIAAPQKHEGQPNFKLFVPNNDLDAKGGDIRRVAEIRSATKHIRPRLFDAAIPLLYVWHFDIENDQSQTHAEHICKIANGLYQLGRGVDMAWAVGELLEEAEAEARLNDYCGVVYWPAKGGQGITLDCPMEDSLDSLEQRYRAGASRFRHVVEGKKVRTEFANAPKPRFCSVAYNSPVTHLLFDLKRTTDAGSPFAPWPIQKAAALVQKLRGSDGSSGQPASGAFEKLAKHFGHDNVEKVLIGRKATDADKALRLRIIPLPSIGHVHADRGIRRVLVEVPPDCPIRAADITWAFSGLELEALVPNEETGEILSSPVELVPADDDSMLAHYGIHSGQACRVWRSITPLALPASAARRRIEPTRLREEAKAGTERQGESERAVQAVIQAVRHAGFRKSVVSVRVQREPFTAKGAKADAFAAGTRFAKERLWHVEVTFGEPVSGPIVLGDGRYTGLGLMAPERNTKGVYALTITDGLSATPEPLELARALRRAVMARAQAMQDKPNTQLNVFFTGHESDGSAASSGGHSHLAFVSDLRGGRLLIIAPHMLEHREPSWDEHQQLVLLERALVDLTELRAGRSGKLRLVPLEICIESDPLFAASTTWQNVAPYLATRHAKRNGKDSLKSDLMLEAHRRGLPEPALIERREHNAGILLKFKVAVRGPILLGRNLHYGGGLFSGASADNEGVNTTSSKVIAE